MPDVHLSSRPLAPMLCVMGLAYALQGGVQATDGGLHDAATAPRVFDIAPDELAKVLLNIVCQGHVPVASNQRLVTGLHGPDIHGRLSVEDVLRRALTGGELVYAQDEGDAFTLRGGQAPVQETRGAAAAPTLPAVVATDTHKSDVKTQDNLSPIDVVSATQLRSSNAVGLHNAPVKLLPSLIRQAQPFNASALTRTQSLRGLNPNHVLVLMNGKRRRRTADLNISRRLEKGSINVDLGTIPVNTIERVEVLHDGASTQYGSDAITGVINVILKSADHDGPAAANAGQTGDSDGFIHGGGGSIGLAFGDSGFANLTAECREQERTIRSGIDERTDRRDNISMGDPTSHRQSLALNSGFGLSNNIEVYSFGTHTRHKASSATNCRLTSVALTLYPGGFTSRPNSDKNDCTFLAGMHGERLLDIWHWDLSSGYGTNRPDVGIAQSVSAAIYRETGNSPRSFDLARYHNSQWTSNLDLGREFQLDFFTAPLALPLDAEYRQETYHIDAGDSTSYYSGGAESLAGLSPLSEGQWSRHVWAFYLDLDTSLTPAWEVDMAVRREEFGDFGSTTNGKFATHYRFDPRVTLRANVSSGFHAPSLVQEHYTGLSVGPTIALGLLVVDSPAVKMLGVDELQPEKSANFNLGLVLSPWENVGLNIDACQISIRDHIIDSATYSGQGAIGALAAAGISLSASTSTVSTHYLASGAGTRTRGVDITGHYLVMLGEYGRVDWELSANFNRTISRKNHRGINGEPLLNAQQVAWVTSSIPRSRVSLGGTWSHQNWEISLHLTRYGRTNSKLDYAVGPDAWSMEKFNHFVNGPKYITDIAARYRLSVDLTLTADTDNLFDVRPGKPPVQNTTYGDVLRYDAYALQIGFNDAFYYLHTAYHF